MRVVRTFAFLDLCGFTAYTEARGDEAAVAVLADLRALLRSETASRGVRVTKWLGDGVMLSGTDAASVLQCSAEVRDAVAALSPLPLRGGLADGPVIMFEGDAYVGAAANVAARLCRAARPNQLLAEAALVEPHSDLLISRALPDIDLRGLGEPVAVREILGIRRRRATPASGAIAAA
jgi:adenylate cyclase